MNIDFLRIFNFLFIIMFSLLGTGSGIMCKDLRNTFTVTTTTQKDKIIQTGMKTDNSQEPGFENGVSGAFIGRVNGNIFTAGGCNFPENPMAPESRKKFYKGIYKAEETSENNWRLIRVGSLPCPIAYGSAVSLPEGLLLMGGANEARSFDNVYLLSLDESGNVNISDYPSLPVKIDNASATVLNEKVYIAGGNINGEPSNRFFVLDIKDYKKGWTELPAFPGNPRIQSVMASGKNKNENEYIYLWGGFAGKGENRDASLNTDGLRYDIKNARWEGIEGPKDSDGDEVSLGGGCCAKINSGKIVITGGVNKDIFLAALKNQAPDYLSHPIEWYNFNPNIFIFNLHNEEWDVLSVTKKAARAGAGMATTENGEIIILGGELKPRIRTPEVFKIKID